VTAYGFRALTAVLLFALLAFLILSFGGVDLWAITIFEVATFALASVWLLRFAWGATKPVWNPMLAPWAILVIWIAVQSAGPSVARYQTAAEALKWGALWLFMAMACQVFTDSSIRSRFNVALVWLAFALCVFGLAQFFTAPHTVYWVIPVPAGKIFGPFVDANHFVTLMELIIPSALALSLRPSEQRPIYIVIANLILAAVVVCGSRAGIVLVAAETAVFLLASAFWPGRSRLARRERKVLVPIVGLAGVAVFTLLITSSRGLSERFEEAQPYALRWAVAQTTWGLFLKRPWTGYGAGTFEQVYPSAAPVETGMLWNFAHNDIVQFAMEWGIVGIAAIACTLALLLRHRWRREVWLCVVLPVLTALAHSWFDFPLQIPAVMAALMVLLAQVETEGAVVAQLHAERHEHRVAVHTSAQARVAEGKIRVRQ
jgi:O-antigen ligase